MDLDSKCKIKSGLWGLKNHEENAVIVRDNELISGIIDKSQIGSSQFGLVHGFQELYGAESAGYLLTAFGRLTTAFLQMRGFTCGLDDLCLNETHDRMQATQMQTLFQDGVKAFERHTGQSIGEAAGRVDFFNRPKFPKGEKPKSPLTKKSGVDFLSKENDISKELKHQQLLNPEYEDQLVGVVKSATSKLKTEIINRSLNEGLLKQFP